MLAYELAKKESGVVEWKDGNNPRVVAYFRDAGHPNVKDDETAWCAAFVGAMLKRAGMKGTGKLTARSYLQWGEDIHIDDAKEGDIVVLKRGTSSWQGHVGFFVGRAGNKVTLLGGNQSNAVNRRSYRIDGGQLLGVRRATDAEFIKPRKNPVQSTTVQASAAQIAAGAGAGVTAVSALDGTAQIITIVLVAIVVIAAMWIMRERLRKWAAGDR